MNKIEVVHHKERGDAFFIARPSPLGNPFKLKKGEEKGSTLPRYREYFYKQIEEDNIILIAELNKIINLLGVTDVYLGCHCAPEPCHGDIIKEFVKGQMINRTIPRYKVLECSSRGDKRFSALFAKIKIFGKEDTIENHYQLAKRFGDEEPPKSFEDAKGKRATHFNIKGVDYEVDLLPHFYHLMWLIYLDKNPHLVEFLMRFDEFTDMFKGKSNVCQADSIRIYIKEGREALKEQCKEFIKETKG